MDHRAVGTHVSESAGAVEDNGTMGGRFGTIGCIWGCDFCVRTPESNNLQMGKSIIGFICGIKPCMNPRQSPELMIRLV